MEKHYCPYCMTPVEPGEPCPNCGLTGGSYAPQPHQLPPGTLLADRYLLGRVLGEGGFGITYIGLDTRLELRVAVKEYYPVNRVSRNSGVSTAVSCFTGVAGQGFDKGRERFIREARTMARMDKTPQIVAVRDYFQENNTAYIVMEYVDGTTFKELVAQKGGRIPAAELLPMVEPLFGALESMHALGLIHRDISPDNLMLENGMVRLLDFGCARESAARGNETMTIVLKQGYSPVEQYQHKGQGPWTDVYSLAATLYYCLTGVTPPQALDRICEDELVPPRKLGADLTEAQELSLLYGMGLQPTRRFRSVREFYASLYQGVPVPVKPQVLYGPDYMAPQPEPRDEGQPAPPEPVREIKTEPAQEAQPEPPKETRPEPAREAPKPEAPEKEAALPEKEPEAPKETPKPDAERLKKKPPKKEPRRKEPPKKEPPKEEPVPVPPKEELPVQEEQEAPKPLPEGRDTPSKASGPRFGRGGRIALIACAGAAAVAVAIALPLMLGGREAPSGPSTAGTTAGTAPTHQTAGTEPTASVPQGRLARIESGYSKEELLSALEDPEVGSIVLATYTEFQDASELVIDKPLTLAEGGYLRVESGEVLVGPEGEVTIGSGCGLFLCEGATIRGQVSIADGADLTSEKDLTVDGGQVELSGENAVLNCEQNILTVSGGGKIAAPNGGKVYADVALLDREGDLEVSEDGWNVYCCIYASREKMTFASATTVSNARQLLGVLAGGQSAVKVAGDITLMAPLETEAAILIQPGASLTLDGAELTAALVVNRGKLNGAVNVQRLFNYAQAELTVSGDETVLWNEGEMILRDAIYGGELVNRGNLTVKQGGDPTKQSTGVLLNYGFFRVNAGGVFQMVNGEAHNRGTLQIERDGSLAMTASFENAGSMAVDGVLEINRDFVTNAVFLLRPTGLVEGVGVIRFEAGNEALAANERITCRTMVAAAVPESGTQISTEEALREAQGTDQQEWLEIPEGVTVTLGQDLTLDRPLLVKGRLEGASGVTLTVSGQPLAVGYSGELAMEDLALTGGAQLQSLGDITLLQGGSLQVEDSTVWVDYVNSLDSEITIRARGSASTLFIDRLADEKNFNRSVNVGAYMLVGNWGVYFYE